MSYSRVSLHRREDGAFLTTIHTETVRSWVWNDYGECSFKLPTADMKALRRYLEIGTLVYVEHEDLPAWGGKILPPFTWNDDETITVNAMSGEAFFMLRRTPWNVTWSTQSAGAMFRRFVAEANRLEDMLIRPGVIWEGGTAAQDLQDGRLIYEHVTALVKNRGHVWSVEPVLDKETGRLGWLANYGERRGEALDYWLKEGVNLERRSAPLRVQRTPVNDLLGVGQGSDGNRPIFNAVDAESRARYGLMQGTEDFDNADPGGVRDKTLARLRDVRYPRNTWRWTVLNREGAFKRLRVGNRLKLKTVTVGYFGDSAFGTEGEVDLRGMRYSDADDTCEIHVDEVMA